MLSSRFTYLIKSSAGTCQKMLFLLADTVTCYEKIKDFSDLRNNARFWLEGIAITLLGLVGLAGNFLSIMSKTFCHLILLIWSAWKLHFLKLYKLNNPCRIKRFDLVDRN